MQVRSARETLGDKSVVLPFEPTLLEVGYPFREISRLIQADRRLNDAVYGAHRWWARRPPALLRSLLLAAVLPADLDPIQFWNAYAADQPSLSGLRIHDPFVGGGSTLVESARLGAQVSGCDVDPLAVAIVRYELNPAPAADIREAGHRLLDHLREQCGQLYPEQAHRRPLHYFWLHEVTCPNCTESGLLYRNLILGRDRRKQGAVVRDYPLTVFCPEDLAVHDLLDPDRVQLRCCGRRWRINEGTFSKNRYHCPACGTAASHKELATGKAPRALVAVEATIPGSRRAFSEPSTNELAAARSAREWLATHRNELDLPDAPFSLDRHDERPLSYGILRLEELFTERQLATLGSAFHWLRTTDLTPRVKAGLRLALSNSLATNNKLCSYAADYGRLSALFSVRGYSLPTLSVELNPLHAEGGRGTLHNCIERVARAGQGINRRHVWSVTKERPEAVTMSSGAAVDVRNVVTASATTLDSNSKFPADLCIFDPPYFDYIAYSELSEFYRGWGEGGSPVSTPLLPTGDDPGESFGLQLGIAMRAALTRLKPGRPLAFTYHSSNPEAWRAVGIALDEAKLRVTAVWPVYSDGHMGHHSHPGNCEWDLVIVCRRVNETVPAPLDIDLKSWVTSAAPLRIGAADQHNIELAITVAATRFGVAAKE